MYVLGGEIYNERSENKVNLLDSFMMYSLHSGDFKTIGTAIYDDECATESPSQQQSSSSSTTPIVATTKSQSHHTRNNKTNHTTTAPKFSFEIQKTGKLPPMSRHSMNFVDFVNSNVWNEESQQYLYVFGGLLDAQHQVSSNQMYAFSVKEQKWRRIQQKGHIPKPRHDHSMCVVGGKMFLFGGTNSEEYYKDLLEFDLSSNTWFRTKTHGKSPGRRSGHSAVMYGTSIYIFGGGNDEKLYNDIFMLNTETLTWTELKVDSSFIPTQRIHHTASVIGNRMLVFGGTGKGTADTSVISFDFDDQKWKKEKVDSKHQSSGPPPLIGHSAIACDSKMWVFGGYYPNNNAKVNAGLLFSLETEVKGVCPISVPKCSLADDMSTLVNDRDVSDLIFELGNGQHIYAHKSVLRVRSLFLYKMSAKMQHTDDMIDLQQMILHLDEKRKKQGRDFPLPSDPHREITPDVFEEVMEHVYTDQIPDFDEMPTEVLRDVCYLARLFRLDRLYKYGLPFIQQLTNVVIPAPTLQNDMLRLFQIAMNQRELHLQQQKDEQHQRTMSLSTTASSMDDISTDSEEGDPHHTRSSVQSGMDVSEDELGLTSSSTMLEDVAPMEESTLSHPHLVGGGSVPSYGGARTQHVLEMQTTFSTYSADSLDSSSMLSYYSNSVTSAAGSGEGSLAHSFCDVLLKLDGEIVPAHRCVLIARSDYFRELLINSQDPHEPYKKVLDLNKIDKINSIRVKTLLMILEFLYTGTVEICFDVALELLIAAEHLDLPRLSIMCQQVLERKIRVHNACQFLMLSDQYGLTHLRKSCSYYIVHHLSQVKKSKPYCIIPREVKYELRQLRKQMKNEGEYDYEQEQEFFSPKHDKYRKHRHSKRKNNFKKSFFNNGKKPKKKRNKKREKKVEQGSPLSPFGSPSTGVASGFSLDDYGM
mmetsp:Transcript_10009/g.37350  ORF Transcript_10009/g.37350 Transcript_10009/m.37350 type:complete len:925 (+) Transcript_10009:969-3743(+)|eukprot:CAMPEP_0117445800 /NCGR_PEP_ID=MMETSP0759-20121206/5990_1 /TAXON_ID=63605 /ORGANISM="Percolomonas cosmopolitus, Strain WS" /LENGTH=924 /DNA_ID=CAMNT_0005238003 /DNA_START=509 /DNA_END=3283 /DNA_ORIENTATION=+